MDQNHTDDELRGRLERAFAEPFEGWDFSRQQGRMVEQEHAWDYVEIVRAALLGVTALLDMDTGGGERLSSMQPLPPRVVATEGYSPNVPIARARLAPLGVEVVEVEGGAVLPFPAGTFDLITNRHGAFQPDEVFRLLQPGGRFITQQVGSRNLAEVNHWLGAAANAPEWTLTHARDNLSAAGFIIERAEEAQPPNWFLEVEAIVYYLKAVSWQVPDFSIDRYFEALRVLDQRIHTEGPLEAHAHRFLLVARKPERGG